MTEEDSQKYVTLLGTRVAKKGFKFVYEGKTETCSNCRLSSACLSNLEAGNVYEVVEVKQVQHSGCKLHSQGAVTVYVVPIHLEINVKSDKVKEGNIVTYKDLRIECNSINCENFRACCPAYIQPDKKFRIVQKIESLKCLENEKKELTKIKIYLPLSANNR
ncbi:MAG: UPF0179 family protein [Candidatus Hodarchaeales archaeon]